MPVRGDLLIGAGAGLAGTLVMSAVMWASQRLGLEGEQPPERVVEKALDEAGVARSERSENLLASVAHLAFGVSCGALYGVVRRVRRTPGHEALHGGLFGLAVWAVSYKGWLPAAGILPPPPRDRRGRQRTMIVAHLVYGVVTGLLAGRRR